MSEPVNSPVSSNGIELKKDFPLASVTSWQVGGPADYYCEPTSEPELESAIRQGVERKLPITFLGGGTNVLIADLGVRGLVICLRKFSAVKTSEENGRFKVEALAGSGKSELLKVFLKAKLEPAIFLAGIPGDVGGGVVMNAGIGEQLTPREFNEITDRIEVWRWSTSASPFKIERQIIEAKALNWSYRHCEGWRPGVIAKVWMSWPMEPKADVLDRVRGANHNRLTKQPLDMPSCGSVFVNPAGNSAGRMVEASGLKGFAIGGAKVSEKHANFIVNTGGATAVDMRAVIQHVQKRVKERQGIDLKTEVIFMGEWSS
ncbi:UDP-N-acetylmuramate dehydrogenase [soil metagenome]